MSLLLRDERAFAPNLPCAQCRLVVWRPVIVTIAFDNSLKNIDLYASAFLA